MPNNMTRIETNDKSESTSRGVVGLAGKEMYLTSNLPLSFTRTAWASQEIQDLFPCNTKNDR